MVLVNENSIDVISDKGPVAAIFLPGGDNLSVKGPGNLDILVGCNEKMSFLGGFPEAYVVGILLKDTAICSIEDTIVDITLGRNERVEIGSGEDGPKENVLQSTEDQSVDFTGIRAQKINVKNSILFIYAPPKKNSAAGQCEEVTFEKSIVVCVGFQNFVWKWGTGMVSILISPKNLDKYDTVESSFYCDVYRVNAESLNDTENITSERMDNIERKINWYLKCGDLYSYYWDGRSSYKFIKGNE